MPTSSQTSTVAAVYGRSGCVGWYVAGRGVWADAAGSTPAGHGDGVGRWDDQSGNGHHLTQPTAASRPACNAPVTAVTAAGAATVAPYGTAVAVDRPADAPSVVFDGAQSWLSVPATLTTQAAGFTVVVCGRGYGRCPVTLGTAGSALLAYGWLGQRMAVYTPAAGAVPFPLATCWPTLAPVAHALRCSAALAETRLFVGANQQTALAANYAAAPMAGGSVGLAAGVDDPADGDLAFAGELLELLVFDQPLADADVAAVLADVQAAHGLAVDAAQVVFVGDELTTGGPGTPAVSDCYPWRLCRLPGPPFKPVMVASPGQAVADQRAVVDARVVPLDRTPFSANVAVVCCGGTDLWLGSATGAAVAADVAAAVIALCDDLRAAGFRVVLATVTPRSAPSASQQVTLSTAIAAANAALRSAVPAHADALADWAADARLADYADATYFNADGWHTTAAGDAVKAERVQAALGPMLSPPAATAAPLTYGRFYAPGATFAGRFGRFPQG